MSTFPGAFQTGKYDVKGGLDPKNTYLTANGTKLDTAILAITPVTTRFTNNPNLLSMSLTNETDTALVMTNIKVWRDSTLNIEADTLNPSALNSTLAYSSDVPQYLSANGGFFDLPDILINNEFAPVIVTALVYDPDRPDLKVAELFAFVSVPEPSSIVLAAIGLGVFGIMRGVRRGSVAARRMVAPQEQT